MTGRQPADAVPSDARGWGAAAHLLGLFGFGFIAPLIIWLIKRDEDEFVEEHAREGLNFQLSLLVYVAITGAIFGIGISRDTTPNAVLITSLVLFGVLGLYAFVFAIWAGVKAAQGDRYRYPVIIRFVRPRRSPTA